MIFDSLTIAGIIMAIIVVLIVAGAMIYSHSKMRKSMRTFAKNIIMMHGDDEIKSLCSQIMTINPNACPLLDAKTALNHPDDLKNLLKRELEVLKKHS